MLSMQTPLNNYSHTMKPLEEYFGARNGSIDITSIKNSFRSDTATKLSTNQPITNTNNAIYGVPSNVPYYQNTYSQPQQSLSLSNIVPTQQPLLYSMPVQPLPLQHSAYNNNSSEVYQTNNNTYNQSIPTSYPHSIASNVPGTIINFDPNVRPLMVTLSPKDRNDSVQISNASMLPYNYTFVSSPKIDFNSQISINLPSDRQNRNFSFPNNVVTANGNTTSNNTGVMLYNRSQSHPTISQNINIRDVTTSSPLLVPNPNPNPTGVAFSSDMVNHTSPATQTIQKLKNKNETPLSDSTSSIAISPSNSIPTSIPQPTSKSQPPSPSQIQSPHPEIASNTPTIASLLVNDTSDTHSPEHKEEEKLYKCNVCNKSFLRAAWLRRHVLTHTSYRQFQCIWCSSKHKRRDNLFKHIKIKHMDYLMDSIQDFYPLAHFESRDLNNLLKTGQLHREDIKKVILSIIKKGQEQNLKLQDKEHIQQQ